jgi:hypothetical protein
MELFSYFVRYVDWQLSFARGGLLNQIWLQVIKASRNVFWNPIYFGVILKPMV